MARKGTSPAQSETARKNGTLGGRPAKGSLEAAKRARQLAREMGASQSLNNLKLWLWIRDNGRLDVETRMNAAVQIENRYGNPAQSVTISAEMEMDQPKTFEFLNFPAPPGWTDQPPAQAAPEESVQ